MGIVRSSRLSSCFFKLWRSMAFFYFLLAIGQLNAQTLDKLISSDGALSDEFGNNVAISGNIAVVGALRNDAVEVNSGAAYIFIYDADAEVWVEEAKLTASDAGLYDEFGTSVAIQGNQIAVGARNHGGTGAVYIFDKGENDSTWSQISKLTASDADTGDYFGGNIAMAANRMMIGAKGDNAIYGYDQGAAYIFVKDDSTQTWSEEAKLVPSASGIIFEFASALDLSETHAIISCSYDNTNGISNSSVYIFAVDSGNWTQQARLVGANSKLGDVFGSSVAIDGNHALVGAYLDDSEGQDAGAVFAFAFNDTSWSEVGRLSAEDSTAKTFFGKSVALSGSNAIIGASGADIVGVNKTLTDVGAAYLFKYVDSLWSQSQKIQAEDATAFDQMGASVAIDSTMSIMGASGVDDNGSNSGAAYTYIESEGLQIDLGDDQVVYLGYDPTSCTSLEITNVPVGSTFLWSTGETSSSITVCPTETSVYSLTVTDSLGNVATDEVKVCVVDINCGGALSRTPKVSMCIESFIQPGTYISLCVPIYQVPTYLGIGASFGDCDLVPCLDLEQGRRGRNTTEVIFNAAPNPFVDQVTILFQLGESTQATLDIYDLTGRKLARLHDGPIDGGRIYEKTWEAGHMIPGVYIYRLRTERQVFTRKMVLSR